MAPPLLQRLRAILRLHLEAHRQLHPSLRRLLRRLLLRLVLGHQLQPQVDQRFSLAPLRELPLPRLLPRNLLRLAQALRLGLRQECQRLLLHHQALAQRQRLRREASALAVPVSLLQQQHRPRQAHLPSGAHPRPHPLQALAQRPLLPQEDLGSAMRPPNPQRLRLQPLAPRLHLEAVPRQHPIQHPALLRPRHLPRPLVLAEMQALVRPLQRWGELRLGLLQEAERSALAQGGQNGRQEERRQELEEFSRRAVLRGLDRYKCLIREG
mmetsp:Transcript_3086/g.6790  ORF Transcript_3086/g.6790 Transcript_3086/m.6790 type:complete len:268 (+) Transcript_3086:3703-4506(+)